MHRQLAPLFCCAALACDGPQSALEPAGRDAHRLADLFWWMTGGTAVIWLFVVALTLYAAYFSRRPVSTKTAERLVVGGGAIFPTVVLTVLLVYGLGMLPDILAPAPRGAMRIDVAGEQWWWRVRYRSAAHGPVDSANEIRLPVGEPVELRLESPDVIHSLWIPSLGGKVDMIPGRRTRLRLHPTRVGTFRGVCAEYCGGPHAWMAFTVVVEERRDFDAWLAREAGPAVVPASATAERGAELFLSHGCGACHTIRGTSADGHVGPDLTHLASRGTLGAGILENDERAMRRWISDPGAVKPGVHMPAFGMLPQPELAALAAYLRSLR